MHGRIKVKTTEQQAEAKRKEREEKLKAYKTFVNILYEKIKNNEYDDEALKISSKLLEGNPEFSTMWNLRKKTLIKLKDELSTEDLIVRYESELRFLETCLRSNPKCYGSWHHRVWVLSNIPTPNWQHELDLCNKFLEYDERNFHCWDYRRYIVKNSKISDEEEFQFTTKKISTNFSNFSSWHYRSKLLRNLHPCKDHIKDEIIEEECDLAKNAFFTDPNDQSAWFYHRWLLKQKTQNQRILSIHYCADLQNLILTFSKPCNPKWELDVELWVNQKYVEPDWKQIGCQQDVPFSYSWIFCSLENIMEISDESIDIIITCGNKNSNNSILSHDHCSLSPASHVILYKSESMFKTELSESQKDLLHKELDDIQQLYQLEPDNKWVLISLISMLHIDDSAKHFDVIKEHLQRLASIDTMRQKYYLDLGSKYLVENKLESNLNKKELNLEDRNLTQLFHMEYMTNITHLNLSGNLLTSLKNFGTLLNVKFLNLDNNLIESCFGMKKMNKLETLSLNNNKISYDEDLADLKTCSNLLSLLLHSNPIVEFIYRNDMLCSLSSNVCVKC